MLVTAPRWAPTSKLPPASRDHEAALLGASPRASLDLMHCAQAFAGVRGRTFVLPDDVKHLAVQVFAHRLMLRPELWVQRVRPEDVVGESLETVPTPAAEDVAGRSR